MENLVQEFVPIIEQLAVIFNKTTAFIEANFMEYILKYGQYTAIKSLLPNFFISILLIILIYLIDEYADADYDREEENKLAINKVLIKISIFLIIIITFHEVIYYLASPEMYSLEEIIKLTK